MNHHYPPRKLLPGVIPPPAAPLLTTTAAGGGGVRKNGSLLRQPPSSTYIDLHLHHDSSDRRPLTLRKSAAGSGAAAAALATPAAAVPPPPAACTTSNSGSGASGRATRQFNERQDENQKNRENRGNRPVGLKMLVDLSNRAVHRDALQQEPGVVTHDPPAPAAAAKSNGAADKKRRAPDSSSQPPLPTGRRALPSPLVFVGGCAPPTQAPPPFPAIPPLNIQRRQHSPPPLRPRQLSLAPHPSVSNHQPTLSSGGGGGGRNGPVPRHLKSLSAELTRVGYVIDGKTPRSIEISRAENRILRIPDAHMMVRQQEDLHGMLQGIYQDPSSFQAYIAGKRTEHERTADACGLASPLDLKYRATRRADQEYRIMRPVGRGRFSTVHYAVRVGDSSPCGLKQIKLALGQNNDKSFYIKCHKEIGLLRNLSHPNIIQYLDSFLEDDTLFIVLEWAAGGDLKTFIRRHRSSLGRYIEEVTVWSIFSQCCEAVRHMHRKRIIHRDIKPSNVFIMANGQIKLGDLGLGRFLGMQSVMAFSQVGTPLYMSPEVLRGEGYDFASDMWSMGCLLYELAMLHSPFEEKTITMDRLFGKIIRGDYPPVNTSVYSSRVATLVDQMIQVKPAARPSIERIAAAALLAKSKKCGPATSNSNSDDALSSEGDSVSVFPGPNTEDTEKDEDDEEEEQDHTGQEEDEWEADDDDDDDDDDDEEEVHPMDMSSATRSWGGVSTGTGSETETLRHSLMEVSLDDCLPPAAGCPPHLPGAMTTKGVYHPSSHLLRSSRSMPSLLTPAFMAYPPPRGSMAPPPPGTTGTYSTVSPAKLEPCKPPTPGPAPSSGAIMTDDQLECIKPTPVRRRHSLSGPSNHRYSETQVESESLVEKDFEALRVAAAAGAGRSSPSSEDLSTKARGGALARLPLRSSRKKSYSVSLSTTMELNE